MTNRRVLRLTLPFGRTAGLALVFLVLFVGICEALITGGLIDSFSLAQIGVFVEDAFDVYIPDTDLTVTNMDTLEQMAARVTAG